MSIRKVFRGSFPLITVFFVISMTGCASNSYYGGYYGLQGAAENIVEAKVFGKYEVQEDVSEARDEYSRDVSRIKRRCDLDTYRIRRRYEGVEEQKRLERLDVRCDIAIAEATTGRSMETDEAYRDQRRRERRAIANAKQEAIETGIDVVFDRIFNY